ncbi:EAL domain-containing protein [Pseudolysobacter antarcticus]|uniref:EAL domain-containing protein n=1 Tax=Pseudolysobacter antarcticus TaxID=2511995 RepID=A0A411HP77_9GAMM|nr:bifunctional diguanylate cyclase/phosphodiesterase [Pseudolysobacter antarcticus]QBB72309.1 EAL domain-containing protein [Pseudolysobacter antarcticus]
MEWRPQSNNLSERDLPPSPSSLVLFFGYVLILSALSILVLLARKDSPQLADLARSAVCATVVVALIYGMYRHRPAHTLPWLLLGASVPLWFLRALLNGQADSIWRLVLIFASNLLTIVFFATLVRYRNLTRDLLVWLDIAIITLCGALLALRYITAEWWHLVDADPLASLRILVLPMVHVAIAGGIMGVALTMRRFSLSLSLILLAQAALLITEIMRLDVSLLHGLQLPVYSQAWNAVAALGLILFGLAALSSDMRNLTEPGQSVYRLWGPAQVTLIFCVICFALTALAGAPWPLPEHPETRLMVITAIVMQAALLARCNIAIRSMHSARSELLHRIENDTLTGLPNENALRKTLAVWHTSATPFALGLFDINKFSQINHTWGYDVGDQVLLAVARMLRDSKLRRVQLYRMQGDVFALLLPIYSARQGKLIQRLSRDLLQKLRLPLQVKEHRLFLSANIGISQNADAINTSPETLLRDAETALFRAKLQGPNTLSLFVPQMHFEITERHRIVNALRQGMGAEFRLVYQPIVTLDSGTTTSHEVLLRWTSPELGEVSPALFIPIAEKAGLICEITHWVLSQAFLQLSEMPDDQHLSINISAHDLCDPEFLPILDRLAGVYAIDPARITLEFTEGALIEDFEHIPPLLRERGYRIAIDDFGTGYSSLSYLMTLSVSSVKLDISFIANIEHDLNQRALCGALISMCRDNGWAVVAEGVETYAQHEILLAMDCDLAQGWWYGKPVAKTPEHGELNLRWTADE